MMVIVIIMEKMIIMKLQTLITMLNAMWHEARPESAYVAEQSPQP